ncbi:MAG TPA: hypothetical protein VGH81_00675 [Rudaea sp.]|jgi:hypothetical protein
MKRRRVNTQHRKDMCMCGKCSRYRSQGERDVMELAFVRASTRHHLRHACRISSTDSRAAVCAIVA